MSLCLIGIPADPSMKFFNKGPDDGYAYEDNMCRNGHVPFDCMLGQGSQGFLSLPSGA